MYCVAVMNKTAAVNAPCWQCQVMLPPLCLRRLQVCLHMFDASMLATAPAARLVLPRLSAKHFANQQRQSLCTCIPARQLQQDQAQRPKECASTLQQRANMPSEVKDCTQALSKPVLSSCCSPQCSTALVVAKYPVTHAPNKHCQRFETYSLTRRMQTRHACMHVAAMLGSLARYTADPCAGINRAPLPD
jgi:hypothetical protein